MLGAFGSLTPQQPAQDPVQQNQVALVQVEPELDDQSDTSTMVAPLQQKLELLKKAVDVDSYYDDGQPGGQQSHAAEPGEIDPMDDMKRLAGIMFNAEEDTDGLEG